MQESEGLTKYRVRYEVGQGDDHSEYEVVISAENIAEAAALIHDDVKDAGGWVFAIEQDDDAELLGQPDIEVEAEIVPPVGMSKYEKEWPYDNCDECGSELLIRTNCEEGELVHDGDDAYCPECKRIVGTISLEEEGEDGLCHAWVNQISKKLPT